MLFGRVALHAVCLTAALYTTPLRGICAEAARPVDPLGSHVRGATPAMNELIKRGARRSYSFRKLIEELNASDVIVYLETTAALPSGLDGRLSFMTSAGGLRYLHVQVINGLGFEGTIAIAGHELQHAVEVAAHREVRDAAGLAALYERIGIPGVVKNRYDTDAAQIMGKRVRAELG